MLGHTQEDASLHTPHTLKKQNIMKWKALLWRVHEEEDRVRKAMSMI